MKSIIYVVLASMMLLLAGSPAEAQHGRDMMPYRGMDLNNDGSITREEWRGSFDRHDRNGDGVLSGDEMKPGARHGQWPSTAPDAFRALDRNSNQVVSRSEWTGTRQDFEHLDQDRNGEISVEEFHQRSELDQFSELDHNRDGVIARDEWHNASRAFDGMDLNRDGTLHRDEFYNQQQYPTSVFWELDRNNDGSIARSEWRSTNDAFNVLDANGDNLLSEQEFNARQSDNASIFRELDRNNDGSIARSEWRSTSDAFARLDANGDGLLSEQEFNARQSNNIIEQIFQEIFRKR